MFYQSVVVGVPFYGVVCWGSSTAKDSSRLEKLIRKAGSLVGMKLDTLVTVAEKRTLKKLMVTDGAANMGACARELRLKHVICIAHTLNLVVKKALDQTPELSDIRAKSRKIVGYFRSSTPAKERLSVVQEQLKKPQLKLIQKVETRWNSTYNMLQRLFEQREPVGAALASLTTDIPPVSSEEFGIISECLVVLAPFNNATTELSQEKRVSGSKVIPLLTMLDHCLNEKNGKITIHLVFSGSEAEDAIEREFE
ncbi:zinc finger BED domain-containing protein 4-like [Neolamprologus brichardi]|uniref:zinc finger BED domain-containing protein 4-like n=1 Tax=Neolamprologus brichardi TaxID=32507 RepID=UPI0016437A45|nr:zinc finger BED domain-containing protein 4-like [Neolamprologus brichardi]